MYKNNNGNSKKKAGLDRIPGWAWVLVSLAAAIILWYILSINPRTSRSFPFIPEMIESTKKMIDNGALFEDFQSSMISWERDSHSDS